MKTIQYKLSAFIIATALYVQPLLAKEDAEKTKNIKKSYEVDNTIKLSIENQFGKVHVNTWDKNTIEIEVNIKAIRSSDSKAQDALDKIKIEIIEDLKTKKLISYRTILDGKINNSKGEELRIDYTISMPAGNSLKLENSFGDVYLAEFSGDLDLEVSYGSFKTEKIKGLAEVELEFGNGEMVSMANGKLEVSYSKLSVEELGNVNVENEFSDLNIGKAGKLELESKYGSVDIREIQHLVADVEFSGFSIDKLYKSLKANMEYPNDAEVKWVSKDVSQIDVSSNFGSIDLGLQKGMSGMVGLKSSFGDISVPAIGFDFNYINKEDFAKEFKGKIGQGGSSNITIDTSYGKIKLVWVD